MLHNYFGKRYWNSFHFKDEFRAVCDAHYFCKLDLEIWVTKCKFLILYPTHVFTVIVIRFKRFSNISPPPFRSLKHYSGWGSFSFLEFLPTPYNLAFWLFLHNILVVSELAILMWGCTLWQAGPQGAASASAAYLLGRCQLSSVLEPLLEHPMCSVKELDVVVGFTGEKILFINTNRPDWFVLTTNLLLPLLTSIEDIILEISIVYCIVHVALLSANVQALSYTELSCGKMIIFCPLAVSPHSCC